MSKKLNEINNIVDTYYNKVYNKIHKESKLSLADKTFHKKIEKPYNNTDYFENVLELGSGNYEHLSYVKHNYKSYTCLDVREPTVAPPQNGKRGNIAFVKGDAEKLDFADKTFDRIISTCLIMHLNNPISAFDEWTRVLKNEGVIEFMVPAEPGLALTLFQRVVSENNAKKNNIEPLKYRLINAFDHVSSFPRIKSLSDFYFDSEIETEYFPFSFIRNYHFNAFAIFRYQKK